MADAFERVDAVGFAFVGDVNVDLGGAYVDVASECSDDFQRDAAFGEHRAERVSERVCGLPLLPDAGGDVLGDDVTDCAWGDRFWHRPSAGRAG
jgi:hypothetical protein